VAFREKYGGGCARKFRLAHRPILGWWWRQTFSAGNGGGIRNEIQHVRMQKKHKVHVSLHTVDITPQTQVSVRCRKLNNLEGSNLVSLVPLLQH